ncbi:MAG: trigger factor [Bacilli bacterium]
MTQTFKKDNGHLIANVNFDQAEIKKATDKAVVKLCQGVAVPGFRKGNAPIEKASHYLHNDAIVNETIDQLFRLVNKEFSKNEEFNSYARSNKLLESIRPAANVTKFSATEAEIVVTYCLRPEVTKLGEYKGLKAKASLNEVTAADVDAEIKKLAENEGELTPTEKEAALGDTVNIDFVGLLEGKEFDGGSAKSFDLELGSNHFVPGFESQCVSHKAGDKFEVSLTMPENYPEPLTAKPVIFKVTLNAVKTKVIPEINDEFASTLSGQYVSKDLAELKTKVNAILNKNAENSYFNSLVNELLLQVRDASEFTIASEYIAQIASQRVQEDTNRIEQQGLSLEEYLKLINKDEKAYRDEVSTGVENEIKTSLVYNGLAEAEKITAPTQADVEKRLNSPVQEFVKNFTSYLKAQKMPEDQIQLQINGYINQTFATIMNERVQQKLLVINGFKKEEVAETTEEAAPAKKAKATKTKKTASAEEKTEEPKAE